MSKYDWLVKQTFLSAKSRPPQFDLQPSVTVCRLRVQVLAQSQIKEEPPSLCSRMFTGHVYVNLFTKEGGGHYKMQTLCAFFFFSFFFLLHTFREFLAPFSPTEHFFSPQMDYWFPYRKWNIRNDMQNTDPNIYEQDPKSSEPIINIINVSKVKRKTILCIAFLYMHLIQSAF